MTEATAALCFASVLLIPAALAGLALMNAGLGRSRNVAHSLLGSLCVAGTAAITWCVAGSAWQGYAGRSHRTWWLAGKAWDWAGSERFLLRGVEFDGSAYALAVMFGVFAVAFAAIIPIGAAGERWRLGASCASTVLFAGIVYPLFAHWAWGGGWLAQLGFIDSGGAGAIQATGGFTALAITWILGPRRGKFQSEGMPLAIPAHNAAFVLFGCFLAWVGYLGSNCAGAILFGGADLGRATVIPVNATLAAVASVLAAAAITHARFGKTDASISANAWIAGLAAISAGSAAMRPAGAIVTGAVAGTVVVFLIEWLEVHLKVDDPGGAVSVHAAGGVWGLMAVGLFGRAPAEQWLAQLVGVATLLGFVLPAAYGLNWLLDRAMPQRVAPVGERQGLDVYELGAGAYPEFMTHRDEF